MYKIHRATEAGSIINQFNHHNFHSQELIKLYPDLRIIYDGENMDYYSELINSEVDLLQWNKAELSSYVYMYNIRPYKEIQLTCLTCYGKLRVNSIPSAIPFLIEREPVYLAKNPTYTWYSTIYESILKDNNFNTMYLSEIQLKIIAMLEEHRKNSYKVDIDLLSNSIKKILVFS